MHINLSILPLELTGSFLVTVGKRCSHHAGCTDFGTLTFKTNLNSDHPCGIFMLDVQAVPMMFITSSQSVANIHSYGKQQLGKGIYKIHFYQLYDLLSVSRNMNSSVKMTCSLQGCKLFGSRYLQC